MGAASPRRARAVAAETVNAVPAHEPPVRLNVNPFVRAFRATRACYQRQLACRRDVWIFSVWLGLITLLGDDAVLWVLGTISGELRTTVAGWGGVVTNLVFGFAPAVGLAVAVLYRDWHDCWRQTASRESLQ